jgi:hypothetical protein
VRRAVPGLRDRGRAVGGGSRPLRPQPAVEASKL